MKLHIHLAEEYLSPGEDISSRQEGRTRQTPEVYVSLDTMSLGSLGMRTRTKLNFPQINILPC